jgi:hypothetical protein
MPIEHIVALLVAERDRLSRAIEALQGPVETPWSSSEESVSRSHFNSREKAEGPDRCAEESSGKADEGVLGEAKEGSDQEGLASSAESSALRAYQPDIAISRFRVKVEIGYPSSPDGLKSRPSVTKRIMGDPRPFGSPRR